MALVKKGPFFMAFMAIKFLLSLVITFMAFYDCVRTLSLQEADESNLHWNNESNYLIKLCQNSRNILINVIFVDTLHA